MIIKAEGIILRSFKYSETSLIVDLFTKEHGILSFIISGVRKKNAKISAAMLQVMNIVDIVGFNKKNQGLGRITEIKNNYIHKDLLYDFIKSSIGIFVIELSRNCLKEKEVNESVYSFMKNSLIYIDESDFKLDILPILYMIHFSRHLGFYPNNNYSESMNIFDWKEARFISQNDQHIHCMDKTTSMYFAQLLSTDIRLISDVIIPKQDRKLIMDHLLNYYQYHVESFKPLKSHQVLEEIMG